MERSTSSPKKCSKLDEASSTTSARSFTLSRMLTKGRFTLSLQIYRVCEEHSYETLVEVIGEVREALEEFDLTWVTYEQLYVIELMLIEQDARRYITEAIEIEKEITSAEVRERAKGKIMVECPEYKKNRSRLIAIFNKINSVANPEGKGRDDL